MHRRDIEIRSPELSSMSTSRVGWTELTSVASLISWSVVLPIALTTTTTSAPRTSGAGHVIGHRTDPICVGNRGPAELLHHSDMGTKATGGARRRLGEGTRATPGAGV